MITGHVPAAYLGAYGLNKWRGKAYPPRLFRWMLGAFCVGNVFPDIDLLYFYFVDHRRHLHHYYWTHLPSFWLAVLAGVFLLSFIPKIGAVAPVAYYFIAGVFVHLVLDTPFGGVDWIYPFAGGKMHLFYMVILPNRHGWWLWNFVLHWSFLSEIAVWIGAWLVFWRDRSAIRVGAPMD